MVFPKLLFSKKERYQIKALRELSESKMKMFSALPLYIVIVFAMGCLSQVMKQLFTLFQTALFHIVIEQPLREYLIE